MSTILITTSSFGKMDDGPLKLLRDSGYNVVLNPHGRKLTEEEAVALVDEHKPVGILAGVEPMTKTVMSTYKGLKAVARCGIGMDCVDQEAARDLGIIVTNTPDAPTQSVAEITLGAILSMLRGIHRSSARIMAGEWDRPMGSLLASQTVGLVGLGRIGSRLAKLLAPFECEVLGCDPYATERPGVKNVSFDELITSSDIVSLHVPYSEETHHMIDGKVISAMKNGAYLVNYSRGGLIDEAALEKALENKHLAGVALDVFEKEPYRGPLREYPNAVLTGHIGSYAREGRIIQEEQAAQNLLASLADK